MSNIIAGNVKKEKELFEKKLTSKFSTLHNTLSTSLREHPSLKHLEDDTSHNALLATVIN